ncbi:putative bifunctional diguanylate cyclase/phosphodiesterase [Sinimarinibacterium thermocellulolyticum]|uniref:EAL domain-containing protein n=1 Tax=Sinimarinibacterium thermocellulolyticum TaxID=3170016 RepID=A0ABV2AB89_9GAMM
MHDSAVPAFAHTLPDLMPAMALLRQFPQPLALLDDGGVRVLMVNEALAVRCARPCSELTDLDWPQLRQLYGDAGATACAHLRPVALDGARALLWLPEHCSGDGAATSRDELTGLESRRAFEARLRALLAQKREGLLIRFEVDQFKLINDAYGPEAGNQLLVQLGRLITSLMREEDAPARLGSDEFAVIILGGDVERAWQIAERIRLQVAAQGFEWNGHAYGVTMSIGIVSFADGYHDFAELIAAADAACEAAKTRGRNRIEIYRRDDGEVNRLRGEQSWGARVLDTLEADRFALYQQRIEPLNGETWRHCEVLLRVRAASGWTTPGKFVAAAERYGLMPQVDRRVIARVLRQLSRLPATQRPTCAINLSGHSLNDQGLASYIARMLERYGVEAERICFEITETAAIANTARAVALVGALKRLGCSVALDDFGAGMSSFSYLKSLDVDMIKIDGSFVRQVATDAVDAATVEGMVKIATLRGLLTVAECVEDEAALKRLSELGVHAAQGFYLHRPEPWSLP